MHLFFEKMTAQQDSLHVYDPIRGSDNSPGFAGGSTCNHHILAQTPGKAVGADGVYWSRE
jgi:hypothetical protein